MHLSKSNTLHEKKVLAKLGREVKYLNIIKGIYDKAMTSITLWGKKSIFIKIKNKIGFSLYSFNIVLEVLGQ